MEDLDLDYELHIGQVQTFKEWSEDGFWIKKGSKSVGESWDGELLFHMSQVHKKRACDE